jgi:hypothetical protein
LEDIILSNGGIAAKVALGQAYLDSYLELYSCSPENADKWEREIRAKTLNSKSKSARYIHYLKSIQGAIFTIEPDNYTADNFTTHVRYINDLYDSVEDSFKDLLAVKDNISADKFSEKFDGDALIFPLSLTLQAAIGIRHFL